MKKEICNSEIFGGKISIFVSISMKKIILNINNASVAFDKRVLFSGVSFSIPEGEMCCITGESGKGKTSLLKAILGFLPLNEGRIEFDSQSLCKENIRNIRKQIAWIPQELYIPAEWVKDMVKLPFSLRANQKVAFDQDLLLQYFDRLGLEPQLLDRRVAEISGGQRQRIMIAVTAMLNKPLIIIDEPTSALDSSSIDKVIDFLKDLSDRGTSILAVTHDNNFACSCNIHIII